MTDRRTVARVWIRALDHFEVVPLRPKKPGFRAQLTHARNAMIVAASESYSDGTHLPAHLFAAHEKNLRAILVAHYREVVPYFADLAASQIKRRMQRKDAEDVYQSLTAEWVTRQALGRAKLIADTDRDDVMRAITRGLEEGLGTEAVAKDIRAVTGLTPFRAATVARTETHQAATYASHAAAEQAQDKYGVRLLKSWLPTLDARTRPDHAAMAGANAIPLDEQFLVGGVGMDRPGDSSAPAEQTVNCRCALAYSEAE